MSYSELREDQIEPEIELPFIEKRSLADRIARDNTARARRQETKQVLQVHSYKEEKDARDRLTTKLTLEKQKKQSRKKNVDIT